MALHRLHLGWVLGSRLLLIEHRGRRTGPTRRTAVEIVERRAAVGRRRPVVDARPLTPEGGGEVMEGYARRRPRTAPRLCRLTGLMPTDNDHRTVGGRLPFLRLCAVATTARNRCSVQ
jgi:hypothetical protein